MSYRLSLCFKHGEFCDGLYVHRKTFAFAVFADSGGLFEGRVAFGSARKAPFWPPGRSPAGFRRPRGHVKLRQKRRNNAVNPNRCQALRIVAPLPGGNAQNITGGNEKLTVQIVVDGKVVKQASTKASYGIAQVSWMPSE